MSKSYKVLKTVVHMGPKNGKTLYSVRPYSYGTLTTDEVAKQISMESTATPADVKAVLDRYAYYVKENLKKGYDIELLTIAVDVGYGSNLWVLTSLDSILLCRQSVSIVTHRVQYIKSVQTLVACIDIASDITKWVTYVQTSSLWRWTASAAMTASSLWRRRTAAISSTPPFCARAALTARSM